MTRQTSIEAYHKIKNNGLLSKRRWQVYDYLFQFGPQTAKQIMLGLSNSRSKFHGGTFTGRLSELKRAGVVDDVGQIKCEFSGSTVYIWDITDQLPKKLTKQKELTAKQVAKITLEFLKYANEKKIIQDYPKLEQLRSLWSYCVKKSK